MRLRVRNTREMWLFVGAVTVVSVLLSEIALLSLYLLLGDLVFTRMFAFYTAAIVPIIVAIPVCYLTGRMALRLTLTHERLRQLAHTDELTGLINRRSFFESAEEILGQKRSRGETLSLLVIDADYFKQLNDTYGHATGDAALQFITDQLLACVRKTDLVCRLGGEEFAVLVQEMNEEQAGRLAARILDAIARRPMFWDDKIIEMSVSCGVADTGVGYDMTALFKAADDALYAAKHGGRNLKVLYSHMAAGSQAGRGCHAH